MIGSSSTTNYHGTPEIYPKKNKSALTTGIQDGTWGGLSRDFGRVTR